MAKITTDNEGRKWINGVDREALVALLGESAGEEAWTALQFQAKVYEDYKAAKQDYEEIVRDNAPAGMRDKLMFNYRFGPAIGIGEARKAKQEAPRQSLAGFWSDADKAGIAR